MRVFLSSILSLFLVGCNSATDDVADETKVEVVADSVPLAAKEVDSILNEIEEKEVIDFPETKVEDLKHSAVSLDSLFRRAQMNFDLV